MLLHAKKMGIFLYATSKFEISLPDITAEISLPEISVLSLNYNN